MVISTLLYAKVNSIIPMLGFMPAKKFPEFVTFYIFKTSSLFFSNKTKKNYLVTCNSQTSNNQTCNTKNTGSLSLPSKKFLKYGFQNCRF